MKLGLVTYNLGKTWDIDTIIKNCAETHVEGVELRSTHAHGVEDNLNQAQRAEVKKKFDDSPVDLYGLGTAFDYHDKDPAKVRENIEGTKRYLQLASDVGAEGIKVRPNGAPEGVPLEKTLEQIGKSLIECGKAAANLDRKIFLEVHGRTTSKIENMWQIMQVCDHPSVGVTWNCNSGETDGKGSILGSFKLLKDRILCCHIQEIYDNYRYPWRELFSLLKGIKYDGYTSIEVGWQSEDPVRVLHFYRALWETMAV